jgi:hypothetical protein
MQKRPTICRPFFYAVFTNRLSISFLKAYPLLVVPKLVHRKSLLQALPLGRGLYLPAHGQ